MSALRQKLTLLDQYPTPLQYLSSLSQETFREIYIKRDDLTPLGGGGNKLRKLEYLMYDALLHGSTTIVTIGGIQTNHGRLTAAVAAKYGLKCIIVTTDEYDGEISANLLLDGLFGAHVVVKKNDGRDKDTQLSETVQHVINSQVQQGEQVYFIPFGGSDVLGLLGYYDCAAELDEQAKAGQIDTATVYVPVGSMGTYLGLYCGLKAVQSRLKLVGIAVKPVDETKLHEYFAEAKKEYGFTFDDSDMHIETGYIRDGYNLPDARVRDAIRMMASHEGILLDPCYTGKMFASVLDMIRKKKIRLGQPMILMHTGGMPGLYTKAHRAAFEKELASCVQVVQ